MMMGKRVTITKKSTYKPGVDECMCVCVCMYDGRVRNTNNGNKPEVDDQKWCSQILNFDKKNSIMPRQMPMAPESILM